MKEKRSKRFYRLLGKFGFELITIIAGILIALFVNNLRERNHDRAVLASTLNSLSREFDENMENIHKIQGKLERFRDTLKFYESHNNLSIYDLTTRAPGLGTAELHTQNGKPRFQATVSGYSILKL